MDKIDIHNSKEVYIRAIKKLKEDLSPSNYKLIFDYLEASSIGKTAKLNSPKKQVGVRGRTKNLYLLKAIARFFNKTLISVNEKDMERLIRALNENKFKKSNKEKFSEKTKSNMKMCFISFLRYYLSEEKYLRLTSWIETRCKEKEIPALEESEIKKLISGCPDLKHRLLISLLFATGARIEEFLNIRHEDIIEVGGEVPYYKITLKNEFSKTKGRTFSILWTKANDLLREWLEENPPLNLSDPLYSSTYDAIRIFIKRLGKRTIKKDINPHLFRHSSATYDANKGMDYFQLCKKYGWEIGSKQPHRYIDRAGIKEKEQVDKFKTETLRGVQDQLELQKQINLKVEEKYSKLIEALTHSGIIGNISSPKI